MQRLYSLLMVAIIFLTCFSEQLVEPPTIDISPLFGDGTMQAGRDDVLVSISAAIQQWGFFQVVNHGIPEELQGQLKREMYSFFHSDSRHYIRRNANNSRGFADDELTKQKVDAKEVWDVGHKPYPNLPDNDPLNAVRDGFNQYPDPVSLPLFRATMEEWYASCTRLSEVLTAALADSLGGDIGIDAGKRWHEAFVEHTSFLRLNWYPTHHAKAENISVPDQVVLGISRHTDAGFLTVLLQDDRVHALQVYSGSRENNNDGEWVTVKGRPGALTVNTGDMLQVWSNDKFKAPEHRVLKSGNGEERYSAAFFYNPAYPTNVEPLHGLHAQLPLYRTINWGQFRQNRFAGDYADRGVETQIEDYRLSTGDGQAPHEEL